MFKGALAFSWDAPGPPWRILAGVFVDVDIDTSLSILLMPLVTGIDPAISLLTFLVGIHRHVRLMGVGYRWFGVVTNTFVASIFLRNRWWFTAHHLLLSLRCQKLRRLCGGLSDIGRRDPTNFSPECSENERHPRTCRANAPKSKERLAPGDRDCRAGYVA